MLKRTKNHVQKLEYSDKFSKLQARTRQQILLRVIFCGSVDDGKSTLLGRLLFESGNIPDDELASLKVESKRFGTQQHEIDFALAADGLAAEREQGITIDVAYRYFSTYKRKFIIADAPGHEQFTRNMITGASTANAAVLIIDAREGMKTQTKRHARILSLMGIKDIILVVNKMDLINFDQDIFKKHELNFKLFAKQLDFQKIVVLPTSAALGENLIQNSKKMDWYKGKCLIKELENISINKELIDLTIFPVQYVNRPNSEFRGYSGTISSGELKVGDKLVEPISKKFLKIKNILCLDKQAETAKAGDPITLTFEENIELSRGSILSKTDSVIKTSNQFQVTIIWMSEFSNIEKRSLKIKVSTQSVKAHITKIKYVLDVNTGIKKSASQLNENDIAVCHVMTDQPIAFTLFENCKSMGSAIFLDEYTSRTIAAGMINYPLRRASNVKRQLLSVTKEQRQTLNGHQAKVIWLTGLSGSGKSTIANALEVHLHKKGIHTYLLDGDNLRHGITNDLGFKDEDRIENIRRVAEVAKLFLDAGIIVIVATISPFSKDRKKAREIIGKDNFNLIYLNTPLEVCEIRDPKGLYKKARDGEIPNFTGIDSQYEPPTNPYMSIDTSSSSPIEISMTIMSKLKL